MKSINFNEIEEIVRLIDLSKSIPGYQDRKSINYNNTESILFFFRDNFLVYCLEVSPIIRKGRVLHYILHDKLKLSFKEKIARNGKMFIFPLDIIDVEGDFSFTKASYDEVVKALLNIYVADGT